MKLITYKNPRNKKRIITFFRLNHIPVIASDYSGTITVTFPDWYLEKIKEFIFSLSKYTIITDNGVKEVIYDNRKTNFLVNKVSLSKYAILTDNRVKQ